MDGSPLDRAAHLRRDPAFLEALRHNDRTLLLPTWRGKSLVTGDPPRALVPRLADARSLLEAADELVFLGKHGDDAYLMLSLRADAKPPPIEGGSFIDLFQAGLRMDPDDFALLGYAQGMAAWHRAYRFDPESGAATTAIDAGFARTSPDGPKLFPRTDPAVMVLVVDGDRCLLARQPRFPPGMFSALAGFVEPGESLEECVYRETLEEVGIPVRNPRYFDSQPWPFPRSLMIGFVAEAEHSRIVLDDDELETARWITRAELQEPKGFFIPPPISLAHHMINAWINKGT
ncbi:MAG: NAD(+) diphosphatase [Myxococcota bacterium]